MISSGRSFTAHLSSLSATSSVGGARGGRGRSRRRAASPAWRTIPPLRTGVDGARRLDAAARLRPRSGRRSRAPRRRSARAPSSADTRSRLLARVDQRLELARDLDLAAEAALLGQQAQEVADERVARRRAGRRPAAVFARASSCGFAATPRSSGTSRSASTKSARSLLDLGQAPLLLGGLVRAPARTCARATAQLVPALLQGGEVELPDGAVDQAAVVVAVEHLAGHLGGGDQRQLGDLVADLVERALGLGLDLPLGLRQPAVAVGLELAMQPARAATPRPCARPRGSARPRRARLRPARGAPRAAWPPRRGPAPPPRSSCGSARGARRSSSGSRPKAKRLSTKKTIRKRPASRSSDPGRP